MNVPMPLYTGSDYESCAPAISVFCNNIPVAIGGGIPKVIVENVPLCAYASGRSIDTWVGIGE